MLISHKPRNETLLTVFAGIPKELTSKAEDILKFVGLYQKRNLRAGDLVFWSAKIIRTCDGTNE